MSVTRDILSAYRAPGRTMARQLSGGIGEERALAYIMIACFLMFIARLPVLSRQAHIDPDAAELSVLVGSAFVGAVFMAPLMFYGVAAVSRLVTQALGGGGSWLSARLALFWSLLAISPLMLLQGMVAGFVGTGPGLTLINVVVGCCFLWLWFGAIKVCEFSDLTKPNQQAG